MTQSSWENEKIDGKVLSSLLSIILTLPWHGQHVSILSYKNIYTSKSNLLSGRQHLLLETYTVLAAISLEIYFLGEHILDLIA